jgi:hypothetical protein
MFCGEKMSKQDSGGSNQRMKRRTNFGHVVCALTMGFSRPRAWRLALRAAAEPVRYADMPGQPRFRMQHRKNKLSACLCVLLLAGAVAQSACIGTEDAKNWRPQSTAVGNDLRECTAKAPPVGPGLYSIASGAHCDSLELCMLRHGYELRSASPLEKIGDVFLFPFFVLAGHGGACLEWTLFQTRRHRLLRENRKTTT